MANLNDDDHLFEEMSSPESPGTIGRNIVRRLGLASQVAEAIRSLNNNTSDSGTSSNEDSEDLKEEVITFILVPMILCNF